MGGLGSGRYDRWDNKETTEDYLQIDIRKWHREGLLLPDTCFVRSWSRYGKPYSSIIVSVLSNQVVFIYQGTNRDGTKQDYNYSIRINYTPCNYGNARPWFICPAVGCGRRVAILYQGSIFSCRKCFRLTYKSQSEGINARATRRADKIREQLDWEPGIFNGIGLKPKGMHWRTFASLKAKHNILVRFVISDFIGRFGGASYLMDDIEAYISD